MTEAVWGRYAEALYTIASDDAVLLERVGFEFGKFTEVTSKFPELAVYFDHPLLELDQKYDFLKKLADEMEISDEVHGLLRSIVKRSRFASLGRILKAFKELLDEEVGSDEAVIYTSRTLEDKELEQIKKRLESIVGKKLATKVKVDPKIIGGVRAEIGHTIYDSSIMSRLNLLKERMVGSAK